MKESMLDELTLKGRVPPMGIAGEYGIISYKKVNIQKLCKWEACRMQLLSGEKGGMTTNLLTKIKCFLLTGEVVLHPIWGALNKPSLRIVKNEIF
ncbi:hypothetical protein, partial [Allisonella histaminiformans]|uniref:hypothetical protein n=1 Tax=Allisonella histaminiformans TaxID=209880 RepID=UPI002E772058